MKTDQVKNNSLKFSVKNTCEITRSTYAQNTLYSSCKVFAFSSLRHMHLKTRERIFSVSWILDNVEVVLP
jgi:hypothetical protein